MISISALCNSSNTRHGHDWSITNTGMVTLDLQKAFDTVNHAILLAKMKALGITTDAVNWFQSYLSDRQQIVDVNGILSNAKDVTCGVPQGSILGPLLFFIYVNDMPGAV